MRLRFIISALLILAPSLRAADVRWPTKIGDWTASGAAETVPAGASDQQALPVLRESGLVSLGSRNYRDGDHIRQLRLYVFRDSSGAYEGYTFLRALEAMMNTNHAIVLESNLVLWIDGNLAPAELNAIQSWEHSISDGIPSPPIARYLPDKGKDLLSERYALGPVAFREAANSLERRDAAALADLAGFSSGAEAMFAQYESGKNKATLLLIDYPTPQLAELHLRHLQRALLAAKQGASVERKGSLLSIVLAPTSTEYAEQLRSAVNYETQVTWNEPSQTATDPPWSTVLGKIFIGTGLLMVVAVVLGAAFGGMRVVTKIFFPGKVFDRPEQMEVLQLGLSGKPIDPRDMY